MLIEIKSGKVNVTNIREFIRVIDKEKAMQEYLFALKIL